MLTRLERIFLFLVVLFLPTQLGKHVWPDFSFIYSLKIDYLSPTLYLWDILVVGLLAVWFLQKPVINKLALNLFLFFLLTQGLSLLGASNVGAGLVRLEQYTLSGLFGVFVASQDFKALSRKIYLPLALGLIGESFLAILQFIKGGTLGLWILGERSFTLSTPGIAKFDLQSYQFLRPYATFPHPNVLAGFILIGICIMHQVLSGKKRLASLALILSGVTVLLTMSRVAILAGVISLLLSVKRRWFVWVVLILLIASPILFTRFLSLFNFDNLTWLRREELLESAWQIFLQQPIFGAGLNNFIQAVAADLTIGPSRFLQPVHNIFLLALSETGLVGFMGLISLMGFPILSSLRKQGSNKQSMIFNWIPAYAGMTVAGGILLPWLIILFLGMFDHYFLTLPQGYRLLFLVWGLSFSMLKWKSEV